VALVIGMAVMAILILAVAPSIGTIMRREREQELIFRGKQYARAIAIFQKHFGRFPTDLKELRENQPRSIRKLWKDPMCNCLDWQPINPNTPDAVGGGARPPGIPGLPAGSSGPTAVGGPAGPHPSPTPGVFDHGEETKNVGPIIGVRSKVHQEALMEWRGQKYYDEWRFIMGDADRDTAMNPSLPRPPGFPGAPAPPRGR